MIERKLSAAALLALAMQAGGVLIWAGATAERIATLEEQARSDRPIAERLARLEAELEAMRTQLVRIENKLERS